jgi:nucleoside-diphosphate-sugar epimerase
LVDLLEASAVAKALQGVPKATHVFFSARAKFGEGGVENVEDNVAMLRNVLDATEARCPGLAHVHLVEGGKWYGQHLGAYPTPAKEDDERHIPPNFYYDQEDLAAQPSGRESVELVGLAPQRHLRLRAGSGP